MYSEEQILANGPLIYEWLKSGKTLKIRTPEGENGENWRTIINPSFSPNVEYEVAPKPLYVNSIGEEFFYEEADVWCFPLCVDAKYDIIIKSYRMKTVAQIETVNNSEIFKTRISALTAAAKYYQEKGE